MRMKIDISMTGVTAMGKREVNNVVKLAFNGAGVYWHRQFAKRHFTGAAWNLYDYTPRRRPYWRRKLRQLKHQLPLVWSGESRLMATRFATVRATHKEARVAMPAYKLNFKSPGQRVDMAKELRTIASSEYTALEGVMEKSITRELRSSKKSARIRIGS